MRLTASSMETDAIKEEYQQLFKVLEALKQASHDLQRNPRSKSSEALLDLETESYSILTNDPNLSDLSHHLTTLKTLIDTFQTSSGHRLDLKSFLARRASSHEISRVAGSIESEIQAWIDRELFEKFTAALHKANSNTASFREEDEEELVEIIEQFRKRVSEGFNRELQDLILKTKVFAELELILCNPVFSKNVREASAVAISELIRFNKDVFVGQVLMGQSQTIRTLISMSSVSSLKVLCSLIKSIKSPLVDEIESNGEIPKIISFLSLEYDLPVRTMAMDCVLEIGYFGRKEAVEAMLEEGLVKRLVELQRSEGRFDDAKNSSLFLEEHPFASCVARFTVLMEVGEGLRQREKRALKREVLKKAREASVSDAEAASIITEVLWGSSPL